MKIFLSIMHATIYSFVIMDELEASSIAMHTGVFIAILLTAQTCFALIERLFPSESDTDRIPPKQDLTQLFSQIEKERNDAK